MALETASFIDGLNSSNPAATDALAQADDHLRLIKAAIKATFPNITGAVTLTQAQINALADTVPAPQGTKMLFKQSSAPTGWVKDTTDDNAAIRVVSGSVSSGGSNGFSNSFNTAFTISGTTGGSGTLSTSASTTGSTTLTVDQIPAHRHFVVADVTSSTGSSLSSSNQVKRGGFQELSSFNEEAYHLGGVSTDATIGRTSETGGGSGHTHSIPSLDVPTHTHSFSDTHNFDVKYVDVIVCTKS